tara:strand:+ start:64 stop:249 length:186 start_codon:yes stop_codon:yes gene_type:complete
MFKKLFRRISLRVWVLQQKFKKEEKENYWQDEWPYESSRTYIWDKEFLKGIINRNKEVDVK